VASPPALALLGPLTALAAPGPRGPAGPRAGLVTAIALVAMRLAPQSRMPTSEIGTACGAALSSTTSCARRPGRGRGLRAIAMAPSAWSRSLPAPQLGFTAAACAVGLVVPLGAVAVAGGLGAPLVGAIGGATTGGPWIAALVAALATAGLVGLLAYQLYDLAAVSGLTPPPGA
jgi:hypothetical protein